MPGYPALRPLLFRLDPETSHRLGMLGLRAARALPPLARRLEERYRVSAPALSQTLFGRSFANPIGLAAGFDKDAAAVRALPMLGFGFVEVGTVTPRPQPGNPRPRVFRFTAAQSLQNALGFNNAGMTAMRRRLAAAMPFPLPVGVNLGKGRATPPEEALGDYEALLRCLGELADYLVVNVSSPNTPGLRDLQNESFLRALLALAARTTARPVLVKIAPDLEPDQAAELAAAAVGSGAAGIVATNTTTDYSLLPGCRASGGLSGQVLRDRSRRILAAVARRVFGRAVLISAGGIDSGQEAYCRIRAGASLVQVYTALVYQGPSLARRINLELLDLLERDGFASIGEAVGADIKGSTGS